MDDVIKQPWYKHPLVWMIIAIPASAVIAGSVTIYLAVSTDDGLVADDYYKQGLAINRLIERDRRASQLRLAAEVEIDPASGFARVTLDTGRLHRAPASIRLVLRHATQQRHDNHIVLHPAMEDSYVGAVGSDFMPGIWYVELSNEAASAEAWRLSRRVRIDGYTRLGIEAEAELSAPR